MSEVAILTAAFLFVGTPLFIALGIVARTEVAEYRHAMLVRRGGRGC